jgi:succinate---hydroxymethylglutarate CoA-transferase
MQEFGLGYESLREINAGIVLCSISGFGATGPLASRPGYDALISAMYGMLHITGEEGGSSVKPGVAITDVLTGLLAHGAVLAALRERDLSGHGQWVDTSLMEGQLSSLVNIGSNYLTTGQDHSKRYGTAHPSIVPYQAFKCIDGGEIMVCVGSDLQFKALSVSHLRGNRGLLPKGRLVLLFRNDFRMVHLNGSSLQTTNVNREPKSTKVSAKHFIGGAAFNAINKA